MTPVDQMNENDDTVVAARHVQSGGWFRTGICWKLLRVFGEDMVLGEDLWGKTWLLRYFKDT